MLHVALALLLVSFMAALLGFTGVLGGVAVVARMAFVLLFVGALAVVMLDEIRKRE